MLLSVIPCCVDDKLHNSKYYEMLVAFWIQCIIYKATCVVRYIIISSYHCQATSDTGLAALQALCKGFQIVDWNHFGTAKSWKKQKGWIKGTKMLRKTLAISLRIAKCCWRNYQLLSILVENKTGIRWIFKKAMLNKWKKKQCASNKMGGGLLGQCDEWRTWT